MARIDEICCTEKYMFKGDHRTFRLTVKDQDGVVVDLTGASLIFTAKVSPTDTVAVITKTSDNAGEIDLTDPTNGVAEIYLVPGDTASLDPGEYVFDVELTSATGKVHTLLTGVLFVKQDITN